MSDRERIAAVEAENIELRSRIAALEAKASPKPRPAAPIDEGDVVRITTVQTYTCAMPTESEYSKLLEIVARAHPQVVPNFEPNRFGSQDWDRRQYLAGFVACFGRLESLWRFNGNELGRDRAEFWVDETNRMLPGTQAYVNKSHLVAACVAWGDVSFSTARWPYDVFVGLSYSTGRDVRRASATWRRVLESGQVRPPVEVGPTRMPTPQPHVSFG